MRVVVTGAAGFVGSHCLRELQARGHEAVGFVRPRPTPDHRADLDGFALMGVDLLSHEAVLTALRDLAPEAVVHAAWYAEPRRYLHDVGRNLESLQAGLVVLRAALEACVPRVVLLGSCLETAESGVDNIYALTKTGLHDVALSPAVLESAAIVCAHLFSPYGPGEHPGRACPSVIRSLLNGDPIAVTAGEALRDYVHIADVSSALTALAESRIVGAVDLCTGSPVRMKDVFATIADELGRPDLLQWGQAQVGPGESFDAIGDPSALLALGWAPRFDLPGGIKDAVGWWRAQRAETASTTS